jgi:hypothetical protein
LELGAAVCIGTCEHLILIFFPVKPTRVRGYM